MSRIVAIARSTFAEALRHRILYLLAIFALVMILFSRVLSLLTVGEDDKIIMDVGMTAINVLGVLVALFVGVGIIFREMERKTIQTTLAMPIARHEYVLGKYFGLATAISVIVVSMSAVLLALLTLRGAFLPEIVLALFMLWVELLFITAAAVFFSSFSTPIFSALFTAATYVVGHLTWSLRLLGDKLPEGIARGIVDAIYFLLPDLEFGDVRALAVHGVPIPPMRIVLATTWELSYAALLLVVACWAFRRRDLV